MQSPRFPRWLATASAAAGAVLLAGTGPFNACDSGRPATDTPVPFEPADGCFRDEECVPTGCEELRCEVGRCVVNAPIRDGDGDGHASPPCGEDCDDSDPNLSPSISEFCDLVDQDCDGSVDEDALPAAVRTSLSTIDPLMVAIPWGDEVLVTDAVFSTFGLRARRLTSSGMLGLTEVVLNVPLGSLHTIDGAPTDDGAVLALDLRDVEDDTAEPEIVLLPLQRTSSGAVAVGAELARWSVPSVTALRVIVADGVPVVAWDDGDSGRWLRAPGWPAAVQVADGLVEGLASMDLDAIGARVVVPSGPSTVAFYEGATGALASQVDLGVELGRGEPVTVQGDRVLVATFAEFDLRFAIVRSGEEPELGGDLPAGTSGPLFLASVGDDVVLVRGAESVQPSARTGWLLRGEDLDIEKTFSGNELSGETTVRPARHFVVPTPVGTALVTNFGTGGSALAVFACTGAD